MSKVLALLMIAALGGVSLVVWVQLDAPVTRVQVNGLLNEAEREQIRRVVVEGIDGGMLSADLFDLRVQIEALSWPRSVAIRRAWPAGLELEVEKPMVVAVWQDAYLSSDGQVVHLPGTSLDLPIFDCSLSQPRLAMEVFHRLSEASDLHGLEITRLSENVLGEWALTFDKGVTLNLGARDMQERLQRFLSVYRARLVERFDEVQQVDARYANGVAVSWHASDPGQSPGLLAAAKSPTSRHGVLALPQEQF